MMSAEKETIRMQEVIGVISQLSQLNDDKNEILECLTQITKNLDTRLSALEKAVEHIEIDQPKFLRLHDNLQIQVDMLAKDVYKKPKKRSKK